MGTTTMSPYTIATNLATTAHKEGNSTLDLSELTPDDIKTIVGSLVLLESFKLTITNQVYNANASGHGKQLTLTLIE